MASPQATLAPSWCDRLTQDLAANDEAAKALVAGLTEEQLNWQASPGSWSIGQCIDHLCLTNDALVAALSAALQGKPRSPVDEIKPGWFGNWFIRSFVEPSPQTKRARAPGKIRPAARVDRSVLDRFLAGNQSCRELFFRARDHDVNRIRFWNPFIPGIRYKVGTGLRVIVGHERRHLLQAQRVQDSPKFPR